MKTGSQEVLGTSEGKVSYSGESEKYSALDFSGRTAMKEPSVSAEWSISIPRIPGPSADPSALPPASAQDPTASAAVSQLDEQFLGRCSPDAEEKASQGKHPRCGQPAVWLKLSLSHQGRANLPQHPGF